MKYDSGFKSLYGKFGLSGVVTCIEGDNVYFTSGRIPDEYVKLGTIKRGAIDIFHNGIPYSWDMCCYDKSRLVKKELEIINYKEDSLYLLNKIKSNVKV